jgi:hypothetical protein
MTMLPDNVKQNMWNRLYQITKGNAGSISYVFTTQKLKGNYSYHKRPDQPCLGGELRKYLKTHGADCTRPEDNRPGDLEHPFPKTGAPAGVAYHFPITEHGKRVIDVMIRADSPWIKAFKAPEYIEYIPVDKELLSSWDINNGYVAWGLSINTGEIDPTVLVNFLKHVAEAHDMAKVFGEAMDNGLSERDALVIATYGHGYSYYDGSGFRETDTYQLSPVSSVKKFIRQETNDLTGGLWSERYDYNRPAMADVFKDLEQPIYPQGFIQKVNNRIDNENMPRYEAVKRVIAEELGEI